MPPDVSENNDALSNETHEASVSGIHGSLKKRVNALSPHCACQPVQKRVVAMPVLFQSKKMMNLKRPLKWVLDLYSTNDWINNRL